MNQLMMTVSCLRERFEVMMAMLLVMTVTDIC